MDDTTLRQNGVLIEHDEAEGVYRAHHDGDADEPLSTVVVFAVAAVAEADPLEIEPLGASLDPSALDDLVAPGSSGSARDEVEVAFSFAGHRVAVSGAGEIEIRPRT